MREYGQIQSAFWQSADAETMSDHAKLLACYLLTGPYTNGLGCFRVTDGNLMDDLGWSSETVSETISELYRIGFLYRLGKVVFLPNFLRWNGIANPKVAIARIRELETLPTQEAKSSAARAMLKFCTHLTDGQKTVLQTISETVSETVLQTLSKQNPTLSNPTQPRTEEREKPTERETSPKGRPQLSLDTWLAQLGDGDAIPEDDPIWAYADQTGIPEEFVILAWDTFASQMRDHGKRQRDWRAHFRNAVKRNWFKLWWFTATGACELTTTGIQAQRAVAAKAAA